jgi:IS5 family transposase
VFEKAFVKHYSDEGRPAKPIRLMVSLLLLKHIRNLSDESVVEQWMENVYYQYFSGEKMYACGEPCEASELVHFRNRIGEEGIELIFKESIRINGKEGKEDEATVDTTVQEKNITYPTDNKLHRKIIKKCVAIAATEQIELRQSYSRTVKKLAQQQRFRNHSKNHKRARKADRKIKTIAGRLVRELERKLPAGLHADELVLFKKVLAQKRNDTGKVYSLHEPHVQCISKGKEHKKYEFGSKVSIITTKKSGVIIGALNIAENDYDAHTVDPAFEQQQRLTGITLKRAFMDRGYKGIQEIRGTRIEIPKPFNKQLSNYQQQQLKEGFKRRAAIEPKIGHLKEDHRLSRNFYKGIKGDNINVMLAAAAMNFKRMINIWKEMFLALIYRLLEILIQACLKPNLIPINQK